MFTHRDDREVHLPKDLSAVIATLCAFWKIDLFIMYINVVFVYLSVDSMHVWCPQKSKEA